MVIDEIGATIPLSQGENAKAGLMGKRCSSILPATDRMKHEYAASFIPEIRDKGME